MTIASSNFYGKSNSKWPKEKYDSDTNSSTCKKVPLEHHLPPSHTISFSKLISQRSPFLVSVVLGQQTFKAGFKKRTKGVQ